HKAKNSAHASCVAGRPLNQIHLQHLVCSSIMAVATTFANATRLNGCGKAQNEELPPNILLKNEVQSLLANLRFRERTLVLLAVTTGLRRSEVFALKWKDVDVDANQIHVNRSIVHNVIGICKTE